MEKRRGGIIAHMVEIYLIYHSVEENLLLLIDFWPWKDVVGLSGRTNEVNKLKKFNSSGCHLPSSI